MKIKVKKAGDRLDKFLARELKDKNRSQIKKIINDGFVFVNEKKVKGSYIVKEKDIVKVECVKDETQKVKKQKIKEKIKDDKIFKKIKIISETDEYLVINKPAGLVVHGADYIDEISLADWLLEKYPKLKGVGEDKERPGIVHRLDKDASGLMVVAKTQKSYNNLKKQFQERTVEKIYKALVYGKVFKNADEINFLIKRSSAGNKQAAVPDNFSSLDEDAREAVTFFEIEKAYINYTLLDIRIKTGRKHQIRVHLHAYGHPLVGDKLYNTKRTKELNQKFNLGRIFLVAYYLSFTDIASKKQVFKINLTKELKDFLKKIK